MNMMELMNTIQGTKQKEQTYGLIATAWFDTPNGESLQIIQSNDLGGKSLEKILLQNFEGAQSESKKKSRFITIIKTEHTPRIIDEWFEHTKLRFIDAIEFYSKPGLFGWNKIDAGSKILLECLTDLKGTGADFGCGYGYLSKYILLKNKGINALYGFDNDSASTQACTMNIIDDRMITRQADCTFMISDCPPLDFVVMNPPFHDGDDEDRSMGQNFIKTAAHHLKKRGQLWIVANKHMPYEKIILKYFNTHERIIEQDGFKVFKAIK
jgi:16S rRNA (guanine1207-N2)-methyltransferase